MKAISLHGRHTECIKCQYFFYKAHFLLEFYNRGTKQHLNNELLINGVQGNR